ncbi:hypothetical protein JIP62_06280 [Brevundimonas vitis]|uniref:Uncharacterized protein n=1 Tax=Brevundimonas vitisensis TaxID=2800818 RepID=A0ABX7BQ49_9CAUL|nr:hypothetical protein [Brevundimonas vitisensis]QQQ19691.1 hypothetical protein JIP62_06280 [Brevundimonas vitisensis]
MNEATLTQPTPRLVEVQWVWRRSWSFLVTVIALVIVAGIVWCLGQPGVVDLQARALQGVAYALIGLIVFVGLIYVVGATAYELVQLIQAAKVDLAGRRAAS